MSIYNNWYLFTPFLPSNCDKPPTLFSILESIVNPDVDLNDPAPEINIKDLAKEGRKTIFNFTYPLSKNVDKEMFETMILNHYLMRRIGFETVTAFRIQLNVKLNSIMPLYNKMFDALENWKIFEDGELMTRNGTDNRTTTNENNTTNNLTNNSTTTNNDISDRRNSELPQNQLEDLRNGSYVTNYNYDTNNNTATDESTSQGTSTSNNNGTDNNIYNETIKYTPSDKISIYKEMQENIKSIYDMIFDELDCLFYGLV